MFGRRCFLILRVIVDFFRFVFNYYVFNRFVCCWISSAIFIRNSHQQGHRRSCLTRVSYRKIQCPSDVGKTTLFMRATRQNGKTLSKIVLKTHVVSDASFFCLNVYLFIDVDQRLVPCSLPKRKKVGSGRLSKNLLSVHQILNMCFLFYEFSFLKVLFIRYIKIKS